MWEIDGDMLQLFVYHRFFCAYGVVHLLILMILLNRGSPMHLVSPSLSLVV